MELLSTVLHAVVEDPATTGKPAATWAEARAAAAACGEIEDEELSLVLEEEDADMLRDILGQWRAGKRNALEHDKAVLKRAIKAFRKRLKVTLLDDESSLGGGAFSSGRSSSIVAITPPERYPRATWDELVRLGRLKGGRDGMYELAPGG
ncbi:hypothetical protein Pla86_11340 [Planctomycetes bacterium Pla86]|uniref:Uncharacterized protein n=2 Tax=Engelhardtia mirabilis TaxID=2528011 RepID=A0A518BGF3_9BACT|nr:hypothetical protein Pla133_11340 [Planctomycetes bacterium Pla133]QDV00395.1 hypothetical protein Pla86_11340 [Planctomycetes bacterium Pla86]